MVVSCRTCGVEFSYEYRGGRKRTYCDGCAAATPAGRYRLANRDMLNDRSRRWREANPELARECGQRWYRENFDKVQAANHEKWQDPERRAKWTASWQKWAEANREAISARVVQWQKDNPDKVSERNRRRRARKSGALVSDFTVQDWRDLLAEHGHACFYCGATGVRLEREHVVPLARGGNHTKSNIVPACGPCNRRKATKTAKEFMP